MSKFTTSPGIYVGYLTVKPIFLKIVGGLLIFYLWENKNNAFGFIFVQTISTLGQKLFTIFRRHVLIYGVATKDSWLLLQGGSRWWQREDRWRLGATALSTALSPHKSQPSSPWATWWATRLIIGQALVSSLNVNLKVYAVVFKAKF